MLRRSLNTVVPRCGVASAFVAAAPRFTSKLRFAGGHVGGPQPPLDHANCMNPGALSSAEAKADVDAQAHRTVQAMVPGKMFMRHWIAGVQAFESIYNRFLALTFTAALIMYGAVYAASGPMSCLSPAHFAAIALTAIFLPYHTHHVWHGGVVIGLYFVAVYFNLLA